jgi:hypothetical protein
MIYKVIETCNINVPEDKFEIITSYNLFDVMKAKKLAEEYYVEKYFSIPSAHTIQLVFENRNIQYPLSGETSSESAKVEAEKLSIFYGKKFEVIEWEERFSKLISESK